MDQNEWVHSGASIGLDQVYARALAIVEVQVDGTFSHVHRIADCRNMGLLSWFVTEWVGFGPNGNERCINGTVSIWDKEELRMERVGATAKSKWRDNWFTPRKDGSVATELVDGLSVGVGFEEVLDYHFGISIDPSNPMCPKFLIDDKERERLCKPFAKSLFVKQLGGSMSLYFLESKLNQIWARKGAIKLGNLENDFFVVSFQEREDYERALIGGPWVIFDKYLSVMRWRLGFNPRKETIHKIAAWVQFLEIVVELFDKKILYNLANSIGKVLKLDVHTANKGRNRFARVCIELNLTKPLVPQYMVDDILKHMDDESLQALCLNCELFGHLKENCVHGKKDHNMGEKVVLKGSKEMEEGEIAESSKEVVGPWRVVQRIRKQRRDIPVNEDVKVCSRYDVLNEENEQTQDGILAEDVEQFYGDDMEDSECDKGVLGTTKTRQAQAIRSMEGFEGNKVPPSIGF
ncbi:hypothetical protein K1719_014231 [Acacia pycnantha]|nr:hypothetical protein K1719_014231 [Acacia pycnantha]